MRSRTEAFPRPFATALVALIAVSTLVASVAVSEADNGLPEPDTAWFEGATGFSEGFEQAQAENQSVLVYFYADWCGYCRQLEFELLDQSTVEDYTKYLVKIRINPEKGAHERQIANRYGVAAYPAVFVHSAASVRPRRVGRMVVDGGKRRLMTPEEYVRRLVSVTGFSFGTS